MTQCGIEFVGRIDPDAAFQGVIMRFYSSLVRLLTGLCIALACQVPVALANDHGGGGGDPPLKFVTNLGPTRYVAFELVLEPATPEVAHHLSLYRPRLQHEIILLLSTQKVEVLQTLKGKLELQAEIQDIANHVIHEDEKSGVKDVMFTSFIIQ